LNGDLFWVALVGGVIGLDRLAVGQFMVSQPIVAAPLIGGLLGDLPTGVLIGTVLELFWLRGLPVGGHVPKDSTLGAILTTGICLLAVPPPSDVGAAWPAWVFFWVWILLYPVGLLDQWVRKQNAFLIRVVESSPSIRRGVVRAVWAGVGIFYLYYFLLIVILVGFLGPLLLHGYVALPEKMLRGLSFFFFLLPCAGVGALLGRKDLSRGRLLCTAGGLIAFLLFLVAGKREGVALAILIMMAPVTLILERHIRAA
jgi:PTS system mannose-specific IIC component